MKKITIAIDGFSSTGKSTIAKQLAKHLNYVYVDTGAMYRAVTLYAIDNNIVSKDSFDKQSIIDNLNNIELKFIFNDKLGFGEIYLNGENVEHRIRTMEISSLVSHIAKIPEVREQLVEQQQQFGKDKGVVMDGRDIGTVVFPDAELKFFMTSSAETRAQRRYDELISLGQDAKFDEVLQNIKERDYLDVNRKDSPLEKAADAIEIDNSHLTREEQFEKVLGFVKQLLSDHN